MKKIAIILALLLALTSQLAAQPNTETKNKPYAIGISKMMSHPALDAIEQGIIDHLGTTEHQISFDLQNCNAEISTAIAIAQKLITDKPVVFGAITDPLAAGLVTNYEKTEETNIAGISDLNPLRLQLETYFRIVQPKRLGMIYTSSEANGVAQMQLAKEICQDNGITFIAAAVSNSAEVKMAAQSIIGRIDAMYVAIDNTVVSAIPSVSEVCAKAGIPLFNTDTTSSENIDFLMSWGFDYYTVGVETGKVVERILNGEKPKDIGAVFFEDPSQFELWFNLDVAKKLGITIPSDLLASARVIIQNGQKVPFSSDLCTTVNP
jgi:putative ABC transport system substrate-binding protein